mgnify:CR=1 FL=1
MATIEMFHGLTAYSVRNVDAVSLRQRADGVIGNEICVADRPIGRIGVVVHGALTHLHAQDVWSRIDSKGRRCIVDCNQCDENDVPFVARFDAEAKNSWDININPREMEQGWVNWYCRDVAPECRTRGDYAEGWMIPSGVSCVWCRTDANDGQYWMAKALAKKLGVAFIEVTKEMRIWNYMPD